MACKLSSESRRKYSWWWDSHISPKSSKWLQDNLEDMDTKVKSMIKLIEEDADSFARRAEMYYKKRPELMKLVEEFYRAYRALAERYDYATSELRHAQRTLAAAFPNQVPSEQPEDSSSSDDPQGTGSFSLQMFLEKIKNGEFEFGNNSKDEREIENLKKALNDATAEKESLLVKYEESLEKFSKAEEELKRALEESKKLDEQARKAENEVFKLKEDLSLLQDDSGKSKVSVLETKIAVMEESAKMFSGQAEKVKTENEKLKQLVSVLSQEKEALGVLYSQSVEKMCKLEKKLQNAEEVCVRLEVSNKCLKLEASELANKIMLKDQELCEKHAELENILENVKNEHTHYVQVEAALEALQMLYTRSQEDQRALALELKTMLQMLNDLEVSKTGLEQELTQVKNDNTFLKNTENEIIGLREMKDRLEEEVAVQTGQSHAMQQEVSRLKDEITELGTGYRALMSQLESTGLDPQSIGSSIRNLRDENMKLKQICEKDRGLSQNIEDIKQLLENNTSLESSIFDINCELEGSRKKVDELRNSCDVLRGEKSSLVLEKTLLLSQLHIITVNMQKLIDQSAVLEQSLATANDEVKQLREKSTGLEELNRVLDDEKCNLIAERNMLASELANLQKRLEILENKFMIFEEKESGRSQLQELIVSLSVEKQERESFMVKNQTKLEDLENNMNRLHEENKLRKEEFQEELDKAVIAQFENFILHKFIEDIEEKNYSLLVDREKHFEASKLADKLISELETEILEQQVEEELLLVEVESLRLGIYQLFLALETGSKGGFKDGYEAAQVSVEDVISKIKEMKRSVLRNEDDKQRLVIENDVFLTLLRDVELHKTGLVNEYEVVKEDYLQAKKENVELVEVNRELGVEVNNSEKRVKLLESEVTGLQATRGELENACFELQEDYDRVVDENWGLSRDYLRLKEEKNGVIVEQATEIDMLNRELEGRKNVEEGLISELRERENEFELWDAEATSFYFDLQVSNTREILFENKVYELTSVCEGLESETLSKDHELEDMKQKASVMESEIQELRAELNAYDPVIGALKENMASLENNYVVMANVVLSGNQKPEELEPIVHPDQDLIDGPKRLEPKGISDLLNFQTRITALEKVIIEDTNTLARRETSDVNTKLKPSKTESKEEKSRKKHYLTIDNLNLTKTKHESSSESRKGVPVRDIPLDQASDGSSSTNSRRSRSRRGYSRTDDLMIEQTPKRLPYEPQIDELDIVVSNHEGKNGKFLQKLNSDAQKLATLDKTVKDLTKRLETSKKSKKTKGVGVDFGTVKEQLEEAEETISQLVNVNVDSVSAIERNPSLLAWVEQDETWKGSEKIKRVQLEVQKIQYVLLKLEDEKKSKGKSRTSVILRHFMKRGGSGGGSGGRRRRLCGCFNTTSSRKGERMGM